MKIKVSEYIADFFVEHGVTDVFMITGGGAMHLDDAIGHKEGINCIYNHHEQACAIAAEGYARLTGKVAPVCVTSGPGGTNAITGVVGAWQDSIPMFVISGQVKFETTTASCDVPLRQLGDQEFQIIDSVKNMTKYAVMITDKNSARYHLEKAWHLCTGGRKGPVWIDVPLDVQAAVIDTDELEGYAPEDDMPVYDRAYTKKILDKITGAKRPVILAGTGINVAGAREEFIRCAEALGIPVLTAWNAHDVMPTDHPLFCGKPGTVGLRGGNFIAQSADLLLVLGCRMNIRIISYNKHEFAKDAYKIVVDIDENELKKPTVNVDMPVCADVKDVMSDIAKAASEGSYDAGLHKEWLKRAKDVNDRYPAVLESYRNTKRLNPYVFLEALFNSLSEGDVTVTGNGGACVMGFQTAIVKKGQRLFTNSGCAAMGYGFPAAVGAAVARRTAASGGKDDTRVICIDGDGSFMMNMQELQTVFYNRLNIKIVILNNNGYHSIRQTQQNLFSSRPLIGVCDGNGLSFPDFEKVAYAFSIPYVRIDSKEDIDDKIKKAIDTDGPVLVEAVVDEKQNFEPKLSSKVHPDGTITSADNDDMFPFLPKEEY
ncbi:MAG: thiamine pyrophosphate-binding protein, partial [Lachnospiraceae bacterium]|nr:thiamine pyrophosphate-binding protein [Lachnospiraceae bacterium]